MSERFMMYQPRLERLVVAGIMSAYSSMLSGRRSEEVLLEESSGSCMLSPAFIFCHLMFFGAKVAYCCLKKNHVEKGYIKDQSLERKIRSNNGTEFPRTEMGREPLIWYGYP